MVYAADPVSGEALAGELRVRSELAVVDDAEIDRAQVAIVAADEPDPITVRTVRAIQRDGCPRVVLVVRRLDDAGLLAAVEAGACGILRRSEATPERVAATVSDVARGGGSLPPELLGRLLEQVGRLQRAASTPRSTRAGEVTDREVKVLRLLADGWDTATIAGELAYSERTVKQVIHDLTTRLALRNRSHAVAYAVRQGLI